jgi:DNA-binding response OmpR family regulator
MKHAPDNQTDTNQRHVLIVDDDHDLVKLFEIDLERLNYSIDHAYTLKDAMPIIDTHKYHWILLDVIFKKKVLVSTL